MFKFNYKSLRLVVGISILFLSFTNCSVEKRLHRSGFFFKTNKVSTSAKVEPPSKQPIEDAENPVASDNSDKEENKEENEQECDIITTVDGDELEVLISEVGIETVRYKKCNNPDGPDFIMRKNQIFMIKYKNGEKEVLRENVKKNEYSIYDPSEKKEETQTQEKESKPTNKDPYANKNLRKRIEPLAVVSFLSVIIAIFALGLILSLVAIVTGIIAMNRIQSSEYIGGLFFAIIGVIAGIIFLIIMLMVLSA